MEAKLIELIRHQPCLYNIKFKYYRDQNMRQAAWEEISQEMVTPVASTKLMWEKLRNAFASAMRRRKIKNGQGAKKIIPWKFEREMSFLVPFLEMRNSRMNLQDSPTSNSEKVTNDDQYKNLYHEDIIDDRDSNANQIKMEEQSVVDVDVKVECVLGPMSSSTSQYLMEESTHRQRPTTPTNGCYETPTRINKRKSDQDIMQSIEKNTEKLTPEYLNNMDETDMFYLSMARTVKKLPQIEQAKIRMQLCQLVSEAEIRQMDSDYALAFSEGSSSLLE